MDARGINLIGYIEAQGSLLVDFSLCEEVRATWIISQLAEELIRFN